MTEASSAQGHIQRGLILKEQSRYSEAEKYFRDALAVDPEDDFAFHQLAFCLYQQEDQKDKALEAIDRAISLQPEDPDHHSLKAFILCSKNKPKDALKCVEHAISLDPYNLFAFIAKAHVHSHLSEWAEAEKAARHALSIDADNATAANQLANALRLQNKMAENADQIRGMLEKDPENSRTHSNAGWAALQKGDRKAAETHFKEALRLDPECDYARQGLLESFKSRSPIYRMYLSYCFFMQRLSSKAQWGIILGLYFGMKFLRHLFTSGSPIYSILAVVYLMFCLWGHVATGVGNFYLLTDRLARYALRFQEKVHAIAVGGSLILGLVLFFHCLFFKSGASLLLGISLVAASFPLAYTFANESKVGTWLFGSFSVFVLGSGILCFLSKFQLFSPSIGIGLWGASLLVAMASTWLANVPSLRRAS